MTISRGRIADADIPERRNRILDTAVGLFLSVGFVSTSIDAVARTSSASKSTVYAYFGDKEGLFTAAIERLHDRIDDSVDEDAPLGSVAASLVETLFSDEAVGLHRLVIGESQRFPELARRFYQSGPSRSTRLLLSTLERHDEHADSADAEALYSLLLGEPHRRRLLGLEPAPDARECSRHARDVLEKLGHAFEVE